MKRKLMFYFLANHTVKLEQGKDTYTFFGDSGGNSPSITNLSEQEIVKWIFGDIQFCNFFLSHLCEGSRDTFDIFFEVKEPILSRDDQRNIIGDIDMMICPKESPHRAIAIEFKRVKVSVDMKGAVKVNKAERALIKGVSQVRKLKRIGFHQTYLGIIIEEDTRNLTSIATIMRNVRDAELQTIYNLDLADITNEIGVLYIRATQPTGEAYDSFNNRGICIDNEATKIEQSGRLVEKVEAFIKHYQ